VRVGDVGGDAVVAVVVDSVGTGVVVNMLRDLGVGGVTRFYVAEGGQLTGVGRACVRVC
jgi:hypothetical protein